MDTKEAINMFVILCIDFMMVLLYLIIGILFHDGFALFDYRYSIY